MHETSPGRLSESVENWPDGHMRPNGRATICVPQRPQDMLNLVPTKLAACVAEIASASASIESFRQSTLELLATEIGFEVGQMHSLRSASFTGFGFPYDNITLGKNVLSFVERFDREELQRLFRGRTVDKDEVFTRARQQELDSPLGTLRPLGLPKGLACAWIGRRGVAGLILNRSRLVHEFNALERIKLDALAPVISLAEELLPETGDTSFNGWADNVGLTCAQRRVSELVARGLTNREIGTLLGTSPLTVRNQLVAIFAKAGVSNRAEMAFAASSGSGFARRSLPDFVCFDRRARAALQSAGLTDRI